MACQHTDPLALESVPYVARPIIITTKEDATRDGERDGSDAAQNVIVRKRIELAVGTNIEQTTSGIVRTSSERPSVGKELRTE